MAYRKVSKNLKEEKEPTSKRKKKAENKFDEAKSDVSALTHKTNKTTGGKALDKHCLVCNK